MKRWLVAAGLSLAALGAPAAVAQQAQEQQAQEQQRGQAEGTEDVAAVVEMTNSLEYIPSQITVRVGDTVEWRNTSDLVHTVTADPSLARNEEHVQLPPGAEEFNSGDIPPGESFRHTFETAGMYEYFCIPHEMRGMLGSVVVLEEQGEAVSQRGG